MDPVNKWLTTIILLMLGVLFVMWHVGTVGKYEFAVEKSTLFDNHAVVYVLDTKSGDVKAQLVDENELHNNLKPKNSAQEVLTYKSYGYNGYRSQRY